MKTSLPGTLALAVALAAVAGPALAADDVDVDVGYITAPSTLSAEDEMDIRRTIASLNHALDAADYALYGSFFADDGEFVSDFGDATGPDGVAAAMEQSRPFITNKRHVAGNLLITGTPERAVVTSYLIVFERAASLDYVGSAINVDTLEPRDGEWKVVRHDSTLDPATAAAVEATMSGQ